MPIGLFESLLPEAERVVKKPTAPGWSSLYNAGEAIYEHGIRPVFTPIGMLTGGAMGMLPGKAAAIVGGAMAAGGVASAAQAVQSGEGVAEAVTPLLIGAGVMMGGGAAALRHRYYRAVGSGEDAASLVTSLATEMPWQSRVMNWLKQQKQIAGERGTLAVANMKGELKKERFRNYEDELFAVNDMLAAAEKAGQKYISVDKLAGSAALRLGTDVYVETVVPGSTYPARAEAGKLFNRVCVTSSAVASPQEREALRREAVRLFSYPSQNPEDNFNVIISANPKFVEGVHRLAIDEGLPSPFQNPADKTGGPFQWDMGSPHYNDIPHPLAHFTLGRYKTPEGQSALHIHAVQASRHLTGKKVLGIPRTFYEENNYLNIGFRRIAELARAAGDDFITWTSGEQQARLLDPGRVNPARIRGVKKQGQDGEPSYWITFFDEEAPEGPPQYVVANKEKLRKLVHPEAADAFEDAPFDSPRDLEFKRHDTTSYFLNGVGRIYDSAIHKTVRDHLYTKGGGIIKVKLNLSNLDPGDIDVQKFWSDDQRGLIDFNAVRVADFFPDEATPGAAQQISKMRYFSTLVPPAVGLGASTLPSPSEEQ